MAVVLLSTVIDGYKQGWQRYQISIPQQGTRSTVVGLEGLTNCSMAYAKITEIKIDPYAEHCVIASIIAFTFRFEVSRVRKLNILKNHEIEGAFRHKNSII